jgi:acylphosphatase
MSLCRRFLVTGRVQGVFYRASTQDTAHRLGLTGWVRNLENGSVELLACGEDEKLQELERWLWQGPPHAQVTQVVVQGCVIQSFVGFSVRR